MSVTLRPRLFLFCLGASIVGVVGMTIAGAGSFVALPVVFGAIFGWLSRQVLHVDDTGVRYRGMFPKEDFRLVWADVSQVVVDIVSTSSPGNPGGRQARARFLRRDAPGLQATLFSAGDGARVLEVCRARNISVIDDRER